MNPGPDFTSPAYVTFQPSDGTLLVSDGVLLYVFFKRQQASVLPVAGMTGVSRMRRTMFLRNRFATDVAVDVDKDRLAQSEEFEQWLMSRVPT